MKNTDKLEKANKTTKNRSRMAVIVADLLCIYSFDIECNEATFGKCLKRISTIMFQRLFNKDLNSRGA